MKTKKLPDCCIPGGAYQSPKTTLIEMRVEEGFAASTLSGEALPAIFGNGDAII